MVLDDSKWFDAQKRFNQEWAPVKDEMLRIIAKPVESEMELSVIEDIVIWAWGRGPFASNEQMFKDYWNERLN